MKVDGEKRSRPRAFSLIHCAQKIRSGYQFSFSFIKIKKVKYSVSPGGYMVYSEECENLFISKF